MTTRKDSAKWREMLKPLILALIALASATTAYVKSHSEVSEGSERNAVSMAKMETRIELIEQRTSKVERESEILKGTLSDIKSDVSFIRGKMEAQKLFFFLGLVFRTLGPSALLAVLGAGGLGTAPNHLRMD